MRTGAHRSVPLSPVLGLPVHLRWEGGSGDLGLIPAAD